MTIQRNSRVILLLRENKPNINKLKGEIISILPANQKLGKEVNQSNSLFSAVYVVDLPIDLENDFLDKSKKLRVPTESDPLLTALKSKNEFIGSVTIDTETLLNYVEVINA